MASEPQRVLSAQELAVEARSSAVRVVRLAFVVVLITVTLVFTFDVGRQGSEQVFGFIQGWQIPVGAAVLVGAGLLTLDVLVPRKRLSIIGAVVVGGVMGGLLTLVVSAIVDLFVKTWDIKTDLALIDSTKLLFGIGLTYLGISVVLQTQDDFRLAIPYVEFAKQLRGPRPMLLDTSALIDARIVELAAGGLVQTPLVIPRFVLAELQTLADSTDKLSRAKGRRGLDAVVRLQRTAGLDVTIDDTPIPGKQVDSMLVELARRTPGAIVTTDSGLERVAGIQKVQVININQVAAALRPQLIPGSVTTIAIVRQGEQPGQGVGYLEDGTMLVVENAANAIGQDVRVEVASALQTSAGRLIFARNLDGPDEGELAPESNASDSTPPRDGSAPAQGDEHRAPNDPHAEHADQAGPVPAQASPTTSGQGAASAAAAQRPTPRVVQPPIRPPGGPIGPGPGRKTPNRNPRRD
jgi:uncharacterized protein YacL